MIEKSQATGLTANYLLLVTKPIELPTDEELWLMSEQYAQFCGLQNFFDECEIILCRHHWIKGYEKAIKDFSTYGSNKVECQFEMDTSTSSATKCKFCGKEKWQHNNGGNK